MQEMMTAVIAAEFALAEKLIDALEESALPLEHVDAVEIVPFGDEQGLRFHNRAVAQKTMDEIDWSEVHYLFFAGDISHAQAVQAAAQSGCVVIDLLGVFASLHDVPLVVPSVNDEQLSQLRNHNIVCLPDAQISQLAIAVAPLMESAITRVFISSLLPASYMGEEQVRTLAGQTAKLLNGIPLDDDEKRLAFDVAPFSAPHFSPARLVQQFQKVLPGELDLVIHPVQSAVFYGLAQQISVLSDYPLALDALIAQWRANTLVNVSEKSLVTPVSTGELAAQLHISDIHEHDNGVTFFTACDEQRFSIARLGVELATLCYHSGY
ncbi:oxidoreductase [Pasteurellaceae bacterium HPA106]|uniref:oxidoreductase n=1 Tax=Spirabiliibacterium pneumoniae TaxID=221400 RepID=UPI001AAC473F|nr:oxidoreductase [Spirabiliibacterium pneumoniae]MBE2895364.1 oxidoreductase [Spirabiliibacterium pneumoniae]